MIPAILGILQGLTEFLPISSSGHLVIGQRLLGFESPGIYLEIALHLATFLTVVVFFHRDVRRLFLWKRPVKNHWLFLIALGTVPAAAAGLIFGDSIERLFESWRSVSVLLCVNGLILFATFLRRGGRSVIEPRDAILIGCAQALAILPGISRSGSTIACALLLGIEGRTAFKFSFLLSLPAILGAGLLKIVEAKGEGFAMDLGVPMLLAFLFGLVALVILRRVVITRKFGYFGIYTLALGVLLLIFLR
jgi:undecaprenyl-diphosphatase